jgi:hypothetical protein
VQCTYQPIKVQKPDWVHLPYIEKEHPLASKIQVTLDSCPF